jgi:heme o synthase
MNRNEPTSVWLSGVKALLQLGKPQITFPVSLSAFAGYILFQGFLMPGWWQTIAGVFLMSFASSAINHVQDAGIDSRMERTRRRPIPSGRVKPYQAMIVAQFSGLAGFLLLAHYGNSSIPAILSLITLACYNLVYTPLKRVTAFAVLPGALVGALPPIIGWTAAGGSMLHPHILLVGFFFFVGQIPHFWLILLKFDKDYTAAGLPTLLQLFSINQIRSMTLGWVAATAMAALLLPIAGVIQTTVMAILIFLLTAILLLSLRKWFQTETLPDPHKAFMTINFFYLAMMVVMVVDAFAKG